MKNELHYINIPVKEIDFVKFHDLIKFYALIRNDITKRDGEIFGELLEIMENVLIDLRQEEKL